MYMYTVHAYVACYLEVTHFGFDSDASYDMHGA